MRGKYLKIKKTPVWKKVLVGIVLALAVAVAFILALKTGEQKEDIPSNTQTSENAAIETTKAVAETTPPETAPAETMPEETAPNVNGPVVLLELENGEIQTPYLTLYYPEIFEDYLLVANNSHNPYILEFYAVLPDKIEQRLFDICLGDGSDGNLGIVQTDAGEIPVSMTLYSFVPDGTWDEGEIDTVLAMQEAANELIRGLGIPDTEEEDNAPDLKDTPEESTVVNFVQIETPYCVLQYPAVWAERLDTQQFESEGVYRTEFYCILEGHEPLLMFTVLFGGDEGEQLGIVTNTEGITVPVNILMNTPSEEGLLDEELEILYSMQEALNYLIQQLPLQ